MRVPTRVVERPWTGGTGKVGLSLLRDGYVGWEGGWRWSHPGQGTRVKRDDPVERGQKVARETSAQPPGVGRQPSLDVSHPAGKMGKLVVSWQLGPAQWAFRVVGAWVWMASGDGWGASGPLGIETAICLPTESRSARTWRPGFVKGPGWKWIWTVLGGEGRQRRWPGDLLVGEPGYVMAPLGAVGRVLVFWGNEWVSGGPDIRCGNAGGARFGFHAAILGIWMATDAMRWASVRRRSGRILEQGRVDVYRGARHGWNLSTWSGLVALRITSCAGFLGQGMSTVTDSVMSDGGIGRKAFPVVVKPFSFWDQDGTHVNGGVASQG
jgi:hypothetical protein